MNPPSAHSNQALTVRRLSLAVAAACAFAASTAGAQEGTFTPPGLPSGIDWGFDFGATIGTFGFADSLYTNPRPEEPSGDLGDNWLETSVKGGLNAAYGMSDSSELYGAISAVGERTSGASPSLVGGDASSFLLEDFYVGWRSGNKLNKFGENAVDVTIGRTRYQLGHGLLLWDGSSEGGSRGGYWTNARQAFETAAIGRFRPGAHTIEAFYLDKDDLPDSDSETKVNGLNYEYAFDEDVSLGLSYMNWSANPLEAPQRDGLDVYNLRFFADSLFNIDPLSLEFEYALEDNGAALDSTAWNVQFGYRLNSGPKLSYRYAYFEGDDPLTPENESFDGLLTGFYDWGTWWQGEIAGEYFVSNSNLVSHQIRLHMEPRDSISTGIILYDFRLDNPASAGVSVDDVAYELDWYMDWSLNDNFLLSVVAAIAEPGDAVQQSSGRTDTFVYGMLFLAYNF